MTETFKIINVKEISKELDKVNNIAMTDIGKKLREHMGELKVDVVFPNMSDVYLWKPFEFTPKDWSKHNEFVPDAEGSRNGTLTNIYSEDGEFGNYTAEVYNIEDGKKVSIIKRVYGVIDQDLLSNFIKGQIKDQLESAEIIDEHEYDGSDE